MRTGRSRASTATFVTVLVSLAGACGASGGDAIDLDVSFDPGMPRSARDQAVRVEVYLLETCDNIPLGESPPEAIASTFAVRDGEMGPIAGAIEPGTYGLYALARDSNCALIAAGCNAVTVKTNTQASLGVTLGAVAEAPCPNTDECIAETGECVGMVDPICAGQADETPCLADTMDGTCWMGGCCTGCWDGATCRPGKQTQHCGTGGELCEFVAGCK